jgi:hypothetical protein
MPSLEPRAPTGARRSFRSWARPTKRSEKRPAGMSGPVAGLALGSGQRPIAGGFATAWHGWCLPCVSSRNAIGPGLCGDLGGATLAQAVALKLDPVGIVDDAVEDGVHQGGIADDLVPARDWQLAGDQQRAGVLEDLQQIAALFRAQRPGPPVVVDQQIESRGITRRSVVSCESRSTAKVVTTSSEASRFVRVQAAAASCRETPYPEPGFGIAKGIVFRQRLGGRRRGPNAKSALAAWILYDPARSPPSVGTGRKRLMTPQKSASHRPPGRDTAAR